MYFYIAMHLNDVTNLVLLSSSNEHVSYQYFTVLLAGGGEDCRDQNLVYLQKVVFCVNVFLKSKQPRIRKNLYYDQRYHVGLT